EAYLRLVGQKDGQHWNSPVHFFAAAGEAMRRIVVEQARRRAAAKRGRKAAPAGLGLDEIAAPGPAEKIPALHEPPGGPPEGDRDAAVLVKLRFFGGMTMGEAALALGVLVRLAQNLWSYSRTALRRRMPRKMVGGGETLTAPLADKSTGGRPAYDHRYPADR